ncbi:MAG: EAL domain-containing protein [Sneathiella sp.]
MNGADRISELRGDKQRFVAFSFAAADLLIELDENGIIFFVAGAAKGITGQELSKLKGMKFVDILDPLDKRVISYLLDEMKEGERIPPVAARMKDTNVTAVIGACSLPKSENHIYVTLNVTGLPAAQARAVARDTDTGVLGKNDFVSLANDQLSLAVETGQEMELTLLQLTNISEMSDNTTNQQMDEFLTKMGSIMRSASFGGDSVGRIDEDKYGILHSKSFDEDALKNKVENLSKEIAPGYGVTIDQSTVDLEKGKLSSENASHALMFVINNYINSENDGFNILNLADGLQGRMESTMNRISNLKTIFRKHQFNLVYQPIVSLIDEDIHHHEVLCRFKDGESPYETVTFAEEVGIILDLDLAVVKKSIDYLKEFKTNRDKYPDLAINISGHSLESDNFIDSLQSLLIENPELREHIGLEITETSQIKDLVRADRILQMFRRNGIQISLDDMGAGAASFEYIRALTVDFVKIDGAYVRDVLKNPRDAAILKCMSRLCLDLKMGTIAEMVETKEQMQLLKQMGVDYGQGWLFSKPIDRIVTPKLKMSVSMNARRKGYKTGWS